MDSKSGDILRLCAIIEYDGTDFLGWQWQATGRTVQRTLEEAIKKVFNQSIRLIASGRTDAGVHAKGQVAHFDVVRCAIPVEKIALAINSFLPKDVRILSVCEVSTEFHARFSAVSRTYEYRIDRIFHPLNRFRAWVPNYKWDDNLIKQAVPILIGQHSFRSFALFNPKEKNYICDVMDAQWEYNSEGCVFIITANRFLHKMVRGLVNALIDLGRGYYSIEQFYEMLNAPKGNGLVRFAPPQGLTLLKVDYGDELVIS